MKKIVILGAGFGGLRAALRLSKKLKRLGLNQVYEVVLVNKSSYHTYTPLLYEVATTSEETATLCALREVAAYDIASIIEPYGITFFKKEVTALDLVSGEVYFGKEILKPEYIVLALGSETNFFGIPGLERYALPLKTFADAVRIRNKVWGYANSGDHNIKIMIVGGGPTGVELAGELKAWYGELEKEFKKCNLDVKIIEAAPTILPGYDPRVIRAVGIRLEQLKIEVIAGEPLIEAANGRIILGSGRALPCDVLIWAGGVKASGVLSKLPVKREVRGRVIAVGALQCLPEIPDLKFAAKVYGLGDSICFYDPITQKPIPAVARAAIVQANVVAQNIIEDIKTKEGLVAEPRHRTYAPREYPYVTPVGGKYAVLKIGPLVLAGFLGWVFKGLIEFGYLLSIMPIKKALRVWLKGLKIFIQNDRLG